MVTERIHIIVFNSVQNVAAQRKKTVQSVAVVTLEDKPMPTCSAF